MKWVHQEQDTRGRDLDLAYLRDVTGREADFVITEGRKPVTIIECKLEDTPLDPSLRYFAARFPNTAAWQISARGKKDYQSPEGIRVAPCLKFLRDLT